MIPVPAWAAIAAGAAALALAASPGETPGAAAAADPATDLRFVVADWQAAAFGRGARGLLAWVAGPAGEVRLDVADPASAVDPRPGDGAPGGQPGETATGLLFRDGSGWTMVAGEWPDPGIVGPWDREWRPAPDGLADLVRAVGSARPGSRARLSLVGAERGAGAVRQDSPEPGRPERAGPAASSRAGFRAAQAERARGGGGPGERLAVAGGPDGKVRIASSRRPGALEIRPRLALTVTGDPAAVFAPWWPLAEVLGGLPEGLRGGVPGTAADPDPEPGTSSPGPR